MKCLKKTLLLCLSALFCSLFFSSSSASAAVPGSNNVRVYTSYMNMNTLEYDPVTSTAINNEDVRVLYPVVDQLSGIFRLLFYPVMTAQSGVKGISIKNIDVMFYTDTPTDPVLDRQVCSHIMAGYGSGGWTSSVSNCGFWTSWTSGEQYAYTHFHFDLTLIPVDGTSAINITSSDLSPFYVTLGTTQYNVNNTIPVYERTLIASSHPVYFGTINYGSITYTKSTTDALLQDVINHQDATTGAIEDLTDTITDSSVDGDFSIDTIEAFGPLGTIVNNLIAFVGDLLTIGSSPCQPLKPPLPQYAGGGTLDITCPSSFMQPYKSFTDAADIIIAAYLWFKVAIYIYHSVENLRNPENDDEEFLEL